MAAAFQLCFMSLAIDVINTCGPSDKMHRQLQPKKSVLAIYTVAIQV